MLAVGEEGRCRAGERPDRVLDLVAPEEGGPGGNELDPCAQAAEELPALRGARHEERGPGVVALHGRCSTDAVEAVEFAAPVPVRFQCGYDSFLVAARAFAECVPGHNNCANNIFSQDSSDKPHFGMQ